MMGDDDDGVDDNDDDDDDCYVWLICSFGTRAQDEFCVIYSIKACVYSIQSRDFLF